MEFREVGGTRGHLGIGIGLVLVIYKLAYEMGEIRLIDYVRNNVGVGPFF